MRNKNKILIFILLLLILCAVLMVSWRIYKDDHPKSDIPEDAETNALGDNKLQIVSPDSEEIKVYLNGKQILANISFTKVNKYDLKKNLVVITVSSDKPNSDELFVFTYDRTMQFRLNNYGSYLPDKLIYAGGYELDTINDEVKKIRVKGTYKSDEKRVYVNEEGEEITKIDCNSLFSYRDILIRDEDYTIYADSYNIYKGAFRLFDTKELETLKKDYCDKE